MLWLCACTGEIDSERGKGPPAIPGVGVPGPNAVAGSGANTPLADDQTVSAADDAMRAADPELFQLASTYFPGTSTAGGPKRLFRLTRTQLDSKTQALLPDSYEEAVQVALPRDPLQTNYEYSDNLSWNAANFSPYVSWVSAISERVRSAPSGVIDCSAENDAPACLDREARRFVTKAFSNVTTSEQLTRFAELFVSSASSEGVPAAIGDLVDVTLSSPSYVFREEVQTDARGVLLPAQLLQNLSYTLADVPPEALGLASSDAASLVGSEAALQQTVEQVLASPEARAKLQRFFLAWLEVKEPADFIISTTVFPEFTGELAQAAVDDTKRFLAHQLTGPAPTLKDITKSTQAIVSPALAEIYGVRPSSGDQPVALDPQQRLGIFTQPAVIASHSGPTTTRLVKRGVFFTRKVMCMTIGAPPDGVNTTLPTTPGATERERVESVTNKHPCLGCHAFINPFGFMQESFDAIGRFRTTDEGLPVNPAIAVDFLDEGPINTSTSVAALQAFTDSARFKQCFTRQVFRFYLGRDELETDDPTLRQMFFNFASADQQDILGMLRLLAGSNALTQRTEAP